MITPEKSKKGWYEWNFADHHIDEFKSTIKGPYKNILGGRNALGRQDLNLSRTTYCIQSEPAACTLMGAKPNSQKFESLRNSPKTDDWKI